MCYTGRCFWENLNGECDNSISHCPEFMDVPCECGEDVKQVQDDGKAHCINCNKVIN